MSATSTSSMIVNPSKEPLADPTAAAMNGEHCQELLLRECQNCSAESDAPVLSEVQVLLERVRWHVREFGLRATVRRIVFRIGPVMKRLLLSYKQDPDRRERKTKNAATSPRPIEYPALGLKAGDLVEVLSEAEIERTLGLDGRTRGLKFMREMRPFCGTTLRVLKPVRLIVVDEFSATPKLKRVRDTVVLESAICPGTGLQCDRCCFFFWREAWLKRVVSDPRQIGKQEAGA
jgi:hypothetical protein